MNIEQRMSNDEVFPSFTRAVWALRKQRFTLLEILSAVAIFSVMLLFIFQVLHGVNEIWDDITRRLEVIESARIAMSIIEADLKGIKASSLEGEQIRIDASGIGAREAAFVSEGNASGAYTAPIYEVGYGITDSKLMRWTTGDSDGTKWNFLDTLPEEWAVDSSWGKASRVVDGAVDLDIVFYKRTLSAPTYSLYDAVADSHTLPSYAMVTLTLIHPDMIDHSETVQNRSKQEFSRYFAITPE